ncbi:hypothetical protein K0M31_010289 [Melipona bicolor]|uniref:Uncharacterized protein n=1 Tax=Melipona bicolor TaxID=60889 RepID=A0AA40FLV0_9HYME|nr:hypothetical protein K0M31_010289 [Melipona bicolor]
MDPTWRFQARTDRSSLPSFPTNSRAPVASFQRTRRSPNEKKEPGPGSTAPLTEIKGHGSENPRTSA